MTGFEELTAFLDTVDVNYGVPGCDCIITKDGNVIYRHSAGVSNLETKTPMSRLRITPTSRV